MRLGLTASIAVIGLECLIGMSQDAANFGEVVGKAIEAERCSRKDARKVNTACLHGSSRQ